ncbi:hypothetical protein ACJRO7_012089 [Eucalyptus globulus]|uniref:Uncharacterized protein n=1 Tax=Eucalyptus globulus TaxID=34317 RepID=A0ABD3LHI7_EUCGL
MTRLHPFQEPSQPPPAAARVPVVVSPPQFDYVPWSTGLYDYSFDFKHCKIIDFKWRNVLVIAWLSGCACCCCCSFCRLKMRKQHRIDGKAIEDFRQNHRVMMASLPPVALVLADGMDR